MAWNYSNEKEIFYSYPKNIIIITAHKYFQKYVDTEIKNMNQKLHFYKEKIYFRKIPKKTFFSKKESVFWNVNKIVFLFQADNIYKGKLTLMGVWLIKIYNNQSTNRI